MTDRPVKPHAFAEAGAQAAELAAMRRMLAASPGTQSISVAICNSPALRNHLIQGLIAETPGIAVLAVPENTEDVYDLARAKVPDSPAGGLFVTGPEESVSSGQEHYPVLRRLNAARELWGQAYRCPVVFWLPEYAATLLSIHARDLWSWKSHQFEFVSEMAAAAMGLHDQYAGDLGLAANLSADQKRFRIAELEQRIAEAGDPPRPELARHVGIWLNEIGFLHSVFGEVRKAIRYYERALAVAREIGDRRGEGVAMGNLGLTLADLGEVRKAIEYFEQSLAIAREIGDRRGEGNALGNLGNAYANLGEVRKAVEYYEQHLAIAREIGDRLGEGNALGNLGLAYADLGEVRRAIEYYELDLAIAREIGDRRGEGSASWNKALALDQLGRRQEAIAHGETALRILREIEDPNAAKVERRLAEWRTAK